MSIKIVHYTPYIQCHLISGHVIMCCLHIIVTGTWTTIRAVMFRLELLHNVHALVTNYFIMRAFVRLSLDLLYVGGFTLHTLNMLSCHTGSNIFPVGGSI